MNTNDFIEKVQVLSVKPGDIIILKSPCVFPKGTMTAISDCMRNTFPDNRFLFLDKKTEIEILRREE